MYDDIKEARQELIDTLLAICVASMRLAIKLKQTQKRKGGKKMHQETDMTTIVNMLRTAAASISETANWLSQQFGDKPTVPTAPKPAITLEQVRAVLARQVTPWLYIRGESTSPSARCGQAIRNRFK